MLAVSRQHMIKDILIEKKSVTVSELALQFEVAEETIRRDFKTLENEGFLTRTYGGAFIQDGAINEVLFSLRETDHVDSKKAIASQCLDIIHNGDTIFLDSSTTAGFLAEALKARHLTVVTDSLVIGNKLSTSADIRLIVVGGEFSPRSMSFIGLGALRTLDNYYVDKAFFSCRSVSMENGITDSNEQLAQIRQRVTQRARHNYLIADYSKFDKTSFNRICGFENLSGIITDSPVTPAWRSFLAERNVALWDAAAD